MVRQFGCSEPRSRTRGNPPHFYVVLKVNEKEADVVEYIYER